MVSVELAPRRRPQCVAAVDKPLAVPIELGPGTGDRGVAVPVEHPFGGGHPLAGQPSHHQTGIETRPPEVTD